MRPTPFEYRIARYNVLVKEHSWHRGINAMKIGVEGMDEYKRSIADSTAEIKN